jgi:sulfonate transport system permease protein
MTTTAQQAPVANALLTARLAAAPLSTAVATDGAAPTRGQRTSAADLAPASPARHRHGWLWGLLLPAALLLAAEAAVRTGVVAGNQLPPPSAVLDTLRELAQRELAIHIAASTLRVVIGFAAGALLAVLLGAATALNPRAHALLDPTIQALRAIPSLAWVPLLLLWLGIDEAPKLTLIAIGGFFPVYMGVASGIRGVDRKLVDVARLYRLSQRQLAQRVLLPAALPSILTGLRNGLGLAWMFMVAAELIAASKGLGYLLSDGRETSRADIVLAAIVLLAILGKASDSLMLRLETRLLAWRDNFKDHTC